jgi:ATP-dependent DNA helicase RecG
MLTLDTEVQFVKGVGPKRAALLRRRGIRSVRELLLHFPRRYDDRSRIAPFDGLRPGTSSTIMGTVSAVRLVPTRSRGKILDVVLTDDGSTLHAKWFNGGHLHRNRVFRPGVQAILTGKPELGRYDSGLVLINPEFEVISEDDKADPDAMGRFVPVYEELAGITSRQLRSIIAAALDHLPPSIDDPLPREMRARHGVPDPRNAFEGIHRPGVGLDIDALNSRRSPAHRRFILEEFLLFELTLAAARHRMRKLDGVRFETNESIRERVKQILPFRPTGAQKRALSEIVEDLRAAYPMNRLLQGDVGSGKTIVAFEAIVVAIENGYQAVVMAPTEILAEQHYINACRTFAPLGYEVAFFRGGAGRSDPELAARVGDGRAQLVIGTHAVLEDTAAFARLGLVVIDEQHRFGVLQRQMLMRKGTSPNTLVMTATPIPRTLALTFYGDLDVSVIDEMPPGRMPVRTVHLREKDRGRVGSAISRALGAGRQCYVVFPLVEESEKLDLRSASEGAKRLAGVFGSRVGLLHGRMKREEKEAVMRAFTHGEIGVLVSTTVVEVGVDVPNATLMIIEHAERFGVAQLHQLRGRVGRGADRSSCFLVTPDRIGDVAIERIRAVVATNDGFRLAEADLRLRGPGELTGTRQSGMPEFRVARLIDDMDLLAVARDEAVRWAGDAAERDRMIEALAAGSLSAALINVG